jgi:hypothetical protein
MTDDDFNPDFARDLLTILDRIETTTDDEDILKLTKERFALAERYGFEVTFYPNIITVEQ